MHQRSVHLLLIPSLILAAAAASIDHVFCGESGCGIVLIPDPEEGYDYTPQIPEYIKDMKPGYPRYWTDMPPYAGPSCFWDGAVWALTTPECAAPPAMDPSLLKTPNASLPGHAILFFDMEYRREPLPAGYDQVFNQERIKAHKDRWFSLFVNIGPWRHKFSCGLSCQDDMRNQWQPINMAVISGADLEVHPGNYCNDDELSGWQLDNLWVRRKDKLFFNVPNDCEINLHGEESIALHKQAWCEFLLW